MQLMRLVLVKRLHVTWALMGKNNIAIEKIHDTLAPTHTQADLNCYASAVADNVAPYHCTRKTHDKHLKVEEKRLQIELSLIHI